jgi:transposase
VSREHRRAKSDRLDTAFLMRSFLGWLRGEAKHCSMAAIPSLAEEDARRPNREHEHLVGERTSLINRMKAAMVRLGVRGFNVKLRKACKQLENLCTAEGEPLPPNTLAELRRDLARLALVREQIAALEAAAAGAAGGHASDDSVAGQGAGDRDGDGGHAGSRGAGPQSARRTGAGALCRPYRFARREREQAAGEGIGQGGQCAGATGHGAAGMALADVPRRTAPWPCGS